MLTQVRALSRKARTALRVLRNQGLGSVSALAADKLSQLSRRAPGGTARLDGCLFDVRNIPEGVREILRGQYEGPERRAMRKYVNRDLPVIELGGSIGVIACLTNRILRHPEQHVVVEGDPALIPKLTANRDRNRCRFEVLNKALAYGAAEIMFTVSWDNRGGGVYKAGDVTAVGEVAVPCATILEVASERQFGRFSLICDIEGSELDLVEHEAGVLSQCVETFIVETHPSIRGVSPTNAMLMTLEKIGFETLDRSDDTYVFRNRTLGAI